MDTQKLLNYMENLRIDRKMSQATYLFEIISQRQYYRYRSGESEIPFDILNKLANKLEIPLLRIISSFQAHTQAEREIVIEIYNLVFRKRLKEADALIKKHNNLLLLDNDNRLFYILPKILLKFYRNQISKIEMVETLKEEIDFSNTMKKQVLHDSELYIMGVIMDHSDNDREKILNKIDELKRNDKLLLSGNVLLNLQAYFWIAKNFGRTSRLEELIGIADMAIELANKNYSYYALEYFYYYKALAYYKTNRQKEFEETLKSTVYALFQVNKIKRDKFFKTIEKDTDVNVKEYVINIIKKEFE